MVNNIIHNANTNIRPASQPSALDAARAELKRREQQSTASEPRPFKAEENFIPSNDSMATFIRSALAALKQGTVWDRGSILNLLV